MPQTIKLKRSATPNQAPTTSQLDLGELAINTADGKLFIRKNDTTTDVIMELNASVAGTASKISASSSAPTDPAPTDGDLWFDTANDSLMVWNGTDWVAIGGNRVQSTSTTSTTSTAPTTRADGSALVTGDTYYNTTDDTIYLWDGSQWVAMAGDEVQSKATTSATAPTVRTDGTALQTGDSYYSTSDDTLYTWNGTQWLAVGGDEAQSKLTVSATEPTTRADGTGLQTGDTFWDTTDSEMMVWTGSSWSSILTDIETQSPHLGSSATVLTQRPNGETLSVGDIYWNTADSEMKVYTGIAGNLWSPLGGAGGGASVTVSDNAPTVAADGDLWYNSADGRTYIYIIDAGGGADAWVDAAPGLSSTTIIVSDTAPTSPNTGDGWLDTAGSGQIYIWDGFNWIAAVGGNGDVAPDSITATEIAANAVGASEIAANAVGASELNVSGNGTAGQALTSDGDGTMSWADVSGGGATATSRRQQVGGTFSSSLNANQIGIGVLAGSSESGTIAGPGGTLTTTTTVGATHSHFIITF